MSGGVDPETGLSRAARAFLERLQQAEPEPAAAFLARHADLREWLEPMLGQAPEGEAGTAAVEPGAVLGPFRLLREIGRGGMGVVYEARRPGDPTPLAVKVLPGFQALQPDRVRRFEREAELVRQLAHPGIVRVRDAGAADGTRWLAMEFVVGAPLDVVLQQLAGRSPARLLAADLGAAVQVGQHVPQGMPAPVATVFQGSYVAAVVRLGIQLGEALAHLHAAGVVHRDVKPGNVLVCGDGRIVLTDFGLARTDELPSLTRTGDFAGTPHYVSPEQAMAKRVRVDHRSDLFSLGSTLYELLTLQRAFPGESTTEVLGRILSKEPPPPTRSNPGLPQDLVTVLARLLEKDPDRRYPDAMALVADLRAFLDYRPVVARRASTWTRVVRWTRREPRRAAIVGTLALAIPALAAGAGYLAARAEEIREGRERLRAKEGTALVDAGFLAAIQEEGGAACAHFERALALDPANQEAGVGMVLALLHRDGPEAALRYCDARLAATLPARLVEALRFPLLHRLGRPEAPAVLARLGEPSGVFELFLHALIERDGSAGTGSHLLEDIERAVLASERPRLWLHLHWAAFADAAGDAPSCRRCAGSLLAAWPDSPVACYFAALALRRVEPERALQLVHDNLRERPDDGILHWAEGVVHEARGDAAAAMAALERAVARLPQIPAVRYALGRLCFDRGDFARALAELTQARDLAPWFVEAWMGIGMAQRRLGRLAEAEQALQRAVELHGTHGEAHFQLGQLLVQRGDLARGLLELRRAADLQSADPNTWHHVASALFATGDVVGGENALRRAVRARPGYERGHSLLVMFLQERGTPAEVREALAAWVQALPASVDGWLQFGRHCVRTDLAPALQDAPSACWAARRVLALTTEQSGAGWLLLGEAHALLGQADPARAALQRALAAVLPLSPAERQRAEDHLAALAAPPAADGKR